MKSGVTVSSAALRLTPRTRQGAAMRERRDPMIQFTRHRAWQMFAAALLALAMFVPSASAQDEPAFVAPCGDGFEWTAESGQPILFLCGWGVQGGPGKIVTFLHSYDAALVVENEQGQAVLVIDAATLATLWGDPEWGPSGF